MMDKAVIKFNPKLPKLSKNEQQILNLLVEAAELIAPIYLEQEKAIKAVSGFFHNMANKAKVEKSNKKVPQISSAYTVVDRVDGKLVTTLYHIKYENLLKPVAEKLYEAARITENKQFGNF